MDDVTIEDEDNFNEDISSESDNKTSFINFSSILKLLNDQWIIIVLLLIGILTLIYLNRNRRRNQIFSVGSNSNEGNRSQDAITRADHMELIRQRQQKAYEEQALRHAEEALRRAEEKKAKMEEMKCSQDGKPDRLKYRSNDHNPLTGQSNLGSGDSCSRRPSGRRRGAGG